MISLYTFSSIRWPRSMHLTATSSRVSRLRISRATPKLPDPMSRTASYFSIPSSSASAPRPPG
uniref:SAPK4 n=1 Tax=Arundo donax TaxID=35708 RepID=A0A0A9EE21_ARUDO